jgi:hypothetical protein
MLITGSGGCPFPSGLCSASPSVPTPEGLRPLCPEGFRCENRFSVKFLCYRTQIATLQEYMLVSQHRPLVEHYVRQPDGTWSYSSAADLSEAIDLPSIDCRLPLSEIYDRIVFPAGAGDTGDGQGRH